MNKLLQLSYSGYAKDNLCILYPQYFFQITYDHYLFSIIRLVLSLTLYKFIVWACWAETQSCLGSKPKLILTPLICFYSAPIFRKFKSQSIHLVFFFFSFLFFLILHFIIFNFIIMAISFCDVGVLINDFDTCYGFWHRV